MRFPRWVIEAAKLRANGRCEKCGKRFHIDNPPEVDHIRERWEGGDGTLANAQVLGHSCCHKPKTAAATQRRAKADRQSAPKISKYPPIPGSRRSGWKHRMDGGWERR